MPLEFLFKPFRSIPSQPHSLTIGDRRVAIQFIRNPRARRYILRLKADGSLRATVPSRGSIKEAKAFAERQTEWITRQIQNLPAHPVKPAVWQHGTEILFRGEPVTLHVAPHHSGQWVTFADQAVPVPNTGPVRLAVERHLWRRAATELKIRTEELAARHYVTIQRITLRNQQTRWGSCSRRGTISLNWRLIQTPPFVRDYIILHELMHRRELNHSPRYWQHVATVYPEYQTAERWLKAHRGLLK